MCDLCSWNATAYFPSTEGVTIVSDIDHILRITQVRLLFAFPLYIVPDHK